MNSAELAAHLRAAERDGMAVSPLTDTHELTVADGYAVQRELVHSRLAEGEHLVGTKLGLTSRAKQQTMGVTVPIHGWLTSAMVLPAEEPLNVDEFIHPRVEPEIVLRLGANLHGPGATVQDVFAATTAVCAGLEIIDSRYQDFRFTLPDVVADNASASRFVLGPTARPADVDLSLLGCVLEVDGDLVASAAGAAVLGHPAEAVALLANSLAENDQYLRAGWTVLAGALTDAVPVNVGTVITATFGRLGSVTLRGVSATA